jgi:hypothetical protein
MEAVSGGCKCLLDPREPKDDSPAPRQWHWRALAHEKLENNVESSDTTLSIVVVLFEELVTSSLHQVFFSLPFFPHILCFRIFYPALVHPPSSIHSIKLLQNPFSLAEFGSKHLHLHPSFVFSGDSDTRVRLTNSLCISHSLPAATATGLHILCTTHDFPTSPVTSVKHETATTSFQPPHVAA